MTSVPYPFRPQMAKVEQEERLENPNRLRSRGAGRKFELELPERLLMSLINPLRN